MGSNYILFSFLLLIPIIPTFAIFEGTVFSTSLTSNEDYVKYDLIKEEHFTLDANIEKISLPFNVKQLMLDYCTNLNDFPKNDEQFWDTMPIRILTSTSEFQSLHGKTNSFVIHSYSAQESCPPNVEMLGIFTSENGDEHKFNLSYNGDFFKYQIDDTFPSKFQVITSPLKQHKDGIPINDIKCKEGLQLIIKASNDNPACVKSGTIPKLIERGWSVKPNSELTARISTIDGHFYVDDEVEFSGKESKSNNNKITSYEWDFGDGEENGHDLITYHSFKQAGTYTVVLTVQDSDGKIDRDKVTITIDPKP